MSPRSGRALGAGPSRRPSPLRQVNDRSDAALPQAGERLESAAQRARPGASSPPS